MKQIRFRNVPVHSALIFLLILSSCISAGDKKNKTSEEYNPDTEIKFISPLSTCIYGKYASEIQGNLKLVPGDFITWEGNGALSWEVEIPERGPLVAFSCKDPNSILIEFNQYGKMKAD